MKNRKTTRGMTNHKAAAIVEAAIREMDAATDAVFNGSASEPFIASWYASRLRAAKKKLEDPRVLAFRRSPYVIAAFEKLKARLASRVAEFAVNDNSVATMMAGMLNVMDEMIRPENEMGLGLAESVAPELVAQMFGRLSAGRPAVDTMQLPDMFGF